MQPDGISPAFGDDANGLRLGQCWAMDGSNGFVEVGPCMVLGAHELWRGCPLLFESFVLVVLSPVRDLRC
jgi:hypothetical protein